MISIPHFSLFINMTWEGVWKMLNDDNGVFSGTGMRDMLGSAWVANTTKTQIREPILLAHSVEPLQKAVSNFLVAVRYFFGW